MFPPTAKWIWLPTPQREKNSYACFRRNLDIGSALKSAIVRVTADTRYELFINGTFVGHGPIRSWPSPWPVDEYDVRHLLNPGKNVVAVLVTHYGISTFQYLHYEPGLIAEIEFDDAKSQSVVTDVSWKCIAHDGYLWPAPRITCQQAWEEQFDARIAPGLPQEWSTLAFDDAKWPAAKELRLAGQPPHENFEARAIPFLTREPVEPVSIHSADVVRPADYTFALNPREFVSATDKSANHIQSRMLLATFIHSDREQRIDLHPPHTRPRPPWKLNGKEITFDDMSLQKTDTGVARARLSAGWNTLMCRLPESEHHFWANLNVWVEQPVIFSPRPEKSDNPDSPWLALGSFAGESAHGFDTVFVRPRAIDSRASAERYDQIWKRGQLDEKDLDEPFCRPLLPEMSAAIDAYAICVSDRPELTIAPRIENVNAMLDDTAAWTTIHPTHEGAGVRVLFDFGREIIGFHEFEIDAPAGTIVDFHNFEFIQRDGRFNLNESMNNSFRYICRDGVQRYRTFLRRGLRYSWMTLRDFHQPLRVRFVRVLMSTYPPTGAGEFHCSDPMLEEIWNAGVHSVRCCSEDTYTDCPTYEQTFWVGDARNEALVDLISNGDARLSAHCLRLAGRSLDRSPIIESQVPSGWQNLLPTWSFLWMRWAQEHYQLTGDAEFAREMLQFLSRNIDGMKAAINDRGLFAMHAWNLFDWAPMDTPADGIVTHINCLASLGLRQSAQLARDLGDETKAQDWDSAARGLADAVNRHLWSDAQGAYIDCIRADGSLSKVFSQQTQTAAYISGVATGDRANLCREKLHNPPAAFVKAGSPFFMFFLLEALAREERYDVLIDTIRSYWGKQIEAGATTFWEMYHEGAKRLTRSHCHGWSAAPVVFLSQHALGVQPLEAGYAKVLIAPKPGTLAWSRGRVPTPRGIVECAWEKNGDRFLLQIKTPDGVPMKVQLPFEGKVNIKKGTARIESPRVLTSDGPGLTIELTKIL